MLKDNACPRRSGVVDCGSFLRKDPPLLARNPFPWWVAKTNSIVEETFLGARTCIWLRWCRAGVLGRRILRYLPHLSVTLGCGTSSDLLTQSLREAWELVFRFVPWVVPHLRVSPRVSDVLAPFVGEMDVAVVTTASVLPSPSHL